MKKGALKQFLLGTALATLVLLPACGNKDAHRTIAVQELNGTVTATGIEKSGQLAVGEHLVSGDHVDVEENSDLTMCADNSKYIYADPLTSFHLETADGKNSNIKIVMDSGSTLHELTEKLNPGDSYEVDTPNSTMAVRGTRFRVTVLRDDKGESYALIEVTDGSVYTRLRNEKGEYVGTEALLEVGDYAVVHGNENISEFLIQKKGTVDENGNLILDIDTENGNPEGVEALEVLLASIGIEISDGGSKSESDQKSEQESEPASEPEKKTETETSTSTETSVSTETSTSTEISASVSAVHEHTPGGWEVTRTANCTRTGERVQKCTECGEVLRTETLAMTAHQPGDYVVTLLATCTTKGHRVQKCSVCGTVVAEEDFPEVGHRPGDWVTTREATCTSTGERTQTCWVCGEVVATESIPEGGHTPGDWVTHEGSCEEDGYKEQKCKDCGAVLATETIPATGHDWGSWVTTSWGDCTSDGEETRTCSRCGASETNSIPGSGHNYVEEEVPNPDPPDQSSGPEYHEMVIKHTCTRCGDVYYTNP